MRHGTEEELERLRPKHPDFERLTAAVRKTEQEANDCIDAEGYKEFIARKTGMSERDISLIALAMSEDLIKRGSLLDKHPVSHPGEFLHAYRMGWAAGFYIARVATTGIDYMMDSLSNPTSDFCGLDKKTVVYVIDQRVMRMIEAFRHIKEAKEVDEATLTATVASCWIDGYFAALNY